ncbi:DUF6801 domain-containing protein [Actinomadura violacea]|uniref:Fibronectin type III domain-containing protein n=1 Tax=Actinomadura violacea TaxID=2819934 RepID=A0ABS3S8D6_9ACTN|nr:DUF6801 domain-containing protein [Actinomadura violacea]MBO2464828.1 fibronectin type III domain-containing protein [Actinomadura violacea]
MRSRNRARTAGAALAVAVAASGLAGAAGVAGAGPAAAQQVTLGLDYHCTFPLLGPEPVHVDLTATVPDAVEVGQQMHGFVVDSVSTVNADSTRALGALYSVTLEGDALADATLVVPEEPDGLPVQVDSTLDKTTLPASGEFKVHGTGTSPDLVFTQAGSGKVTVGNLLLTLTPRTDDGGPTGLGTFQSECTQDPGQNNVLAGFQIDLPGAQGPSKPGTPTVTAHTSTSATLTWGASTDTGGTVTGYDVYSNGSVVASSTGTTATVPNLTPKTTYTFTVKAKDDKGNVSDPSDPVTVTTDAAGPASHAYTLKGTTTIKASNGTAPLTGVLNAQIAPDTGAVTGDLALDPADASLQALGFLPVTAHLTFANQGPTTGTYANGALGTQTRVLVKASSFAAFGIVPIGGGDQCQASAPSTLKLASAGTFDPAAGGAVKGGYDLAALTNCGPITGLLSPLVAGTGNTADLALTPKSGS